MMHFASLICCVALLRLLLVMVLTWRKQQQYMLLRDQVLCKDLACCPFLRSEFVWHAEVVLFTAGLEDYAAPICDALEKHYGAFTARLYRPATVACDVYPCVKVCVGFARSGLKPICCLMPVLHYMSL